MTYYGSTYIKADVFAYIYRPVSAYLILLNQGRGLLSQTEHSLKLISIKPNSISTPPLDRKKSKESPISMATSLHAPRIISLN